MNTKLLKRLIVGCFITVPILSSLISTVHLVDMFYLGNPNWIAITVAVAIEVGAVASFLTLSILSKLNKTIVWSMFILLFLMQVIGNVYFSYDWVTDKIAVDPTWLSTFKEMIEFFSYEMTEKTAKMILAMFVGIPIPLISVFLLKSIADYIGTDISDGASIVPTEIAPITPQPIVQENKVTESVPLSEVKPELWENEDEKKS